MNGRYGDLDYPRLTKLGVGLGLALFALGAIGGVAAPSVLGPLPGGEAARFFDLEAAGVVLALLSPFVFGILLPLTE